MHSFSSIKNPQNQKGLALVILVVAIALAFISYIVSELSVQELKRQNDEKTFETLKKAKQALINYAVTYGDIDGNDADVLPDFPGEYGFLPCPDYNNGLNEGLEDNGNCGTRGVPKMGFFPWRTLGLPALKDDSGTCLLYAVSGDYKNDEAGTPNKAFMLNEDSNGVFQLVDESDTVIKGVQPEDRIVAIVFSAGTAIGDQDRPFDPASVCGRDYGSPPLYEMPDYLEGDGTTDNSVISNAANTIDKFIHAAINSENAATPYNDRFITISRDEIWEAITARADFNQKITYLTEALAECLAKYGFVGGNSRLPWPGKMALFDYRDDNQYIDVLGPVPPGPIPASNAYAGRVPFKVDNSNTITPLSVANLFETTGCDTITLGGGAVNINLSDTNDEYRKLWQNWKDHFFYALSKEFEPDNDPANTCPPANCIQVDNGVTSTHVAAIIFFGNSRQVGQVRAAPPLDGDFKVDVANYLEGINPNTFVNAVGDNADIYELNPGNDLMYCIFADTLPFGAGSVGPCP